MSADASLEAIKASLQSAFPANKVQRSLADPATLPDDELKEGVLCLVAGGGGQFANYLGREGELGHMDVSVVAFLKVDEDTDPEAIERAELQLLERVLDWTGNTGNIDPASSVLPEGWVQSKQLEHPYGWFVLRLDVQF